MKLRCLTVRLGFQDLFTKGKDYPVLSISPNLKMVKVTADTGEHCQTMVETSCYGKFQLIEDDV